MLLVNFVFVASQYGFAVSFDQQAFDYRGMEVGVGCV